MLGQRVTVRALLVEDDDDTVTMSTIAAIREPLRLATSIAWK
jgi:hypothetical protein